MDCWRQSHSEPSCDIHHLYTVLGMRLVMAMYICHEDIHSTSWHGSKDIALHVTHYSWSDASTVPLSSECRWTNKHYKVLIILFESDSCKIKHIQKMKSLSTTTTLTKSNLLHRSYEAHSWDWSHTPYLTVYVTRSWDLLICVRKKQYHMLPW